jgi:16S rRNA (guanine1207-N2)-methyltransferase
MPASLLSADSAAFQRSRELLAEYPRFDDRPGLPRARMLLDYIIGRRAGELDVSGRDTEGTFIDAEVAGHLPERIVIVDDAHGIQTALLSRIAEVVVYHDRIDEPRTAASIVADSSNAETTAGTADPTATARPAADTPAQAPSLREIDELTEEALESSPVGCDTEADRASSAVTAAEVTWAIINAPKATNSLAESIAALQRSVSVIIVIGRSDSMSRSVNKELARGFGRVDVSPGVGKHRMIIGSRPLSSPTLPRFPKHGTIAHAQVGDIAVRAHGACFSGVKSDEGSTLLLDALHDTTSAAGEASAGGTASDPDAPSGTGPTSQVESVLDLGCGNGWLLTAAMRATGASRGAGVDVSKAAVASARATAEANGIDVDIVLGDAANPDDEAVAGIGTFELIVLNPPFHQGTTIETDTAEALMATARSHLAPGGRVLTVFNTHLRYRDRLEAIIGESEQLARNKKFTVISSRGTAAS